MNLSSPDPARPLLQVRGARASSVIVQRIPPDDAAPFMEWQRGITAIAADFPGYQTTEVYPPTEPKLEWVIVIHFDDAKCLQDWLDSPKRAECIAQLPSETRDYQLKLLPSGFGSWFAGLAADGGLPPHWKMALTVLLGLYPTVMLLSILVMPAPDRFGMAVTMLIGNILGVCLLEWIVMPVINRVLGPWLRANGKEGRVLSLLGLILILLALAVMTFLFSLVTQHS